MIILAAGLGTTGGFFPAAAAASSTMVGPTPASEALIPAGLTLAPGTAVAGGGEHSLALTGDSTVWAWGDNSYGQLGNGTATGSDIPVQVSALVGVTTIAAGLRHSLAVRADRTVWAWGDNSYGQLGDCCVPRVRSAPVEVRDFGGGTAVAAGFFHSLALVGDGTVWAWGDNTYGQLGNCCFTRSYLPVQVVGLGGVTAIAADGYHSLALKGDGTVWAWGDNSYRPQQVSGLSGVTAVAEGGTHSLALKGDGTVWAWGDNSYGQLGNGTTANSSTPVQVSGLGGVRAIAARAAHSLALVGDTTVWAWGDNSYGQLGNGTTTNSSTPVGVFGLVGVTAIAAGSLHSLAVRADGTVWAWGDNSSGQLGNGTTTNSSTPQQVHGLGVTFGLSPSGCLTQTVTGPGSTAQINAVNDAFDPALHATCANETVNDTGGGSGAGNASQLNRTAPIGFSDEPMNPTLWAQTMAGSGTNASPINHIPVAVMPISVIANLPCAGANQVRLSSESIAKAYDGIFTTWDQALQLDNPASIVAACKNQPIKLIARAEVSGTTYIFKNYLSKRNLEYVAFEQDALNTIWPAETLGRAKVTKYNGTSGVIGNLGPLPPASGVLGTPNSLGYAATSNVIKAGILSTTSPTRQVPVDTGARSFSTWTSGSCATAATTATIPGSTLNNWSQVSFTDPGVGYPICGFTYDLVFQNLKTAVGANHDVAQTVVDFENAALSPAGQGVNLTDNGYDRLPAPALTVAKTGVSLISDN